MSKFGRNSLVVLLVFGLLSASAQAVVIVDYASVSPPAIGFGNRSMPGIVIQSETEFQMQRARAWHGYQRTDPKTGAMLVYPARVGAIGSPTSSRQVEIRNNILRAHAYRLEYNKR
ncbi:MAG: hypothetical protein PHV02_04275 [Rhodocyclaceae bacterium]|nr:hypothetical protein [Rhodocyclaceae bacterium]